MPGRFKIVVSDLHMSAGHAQAGNPLEDFGSEGEFVAFLGEIAAESERDGADVELILNGDTFEMLQVPHVDAFDPLAVYPPEQYHSSSEADSERKIALTIAGHWPFFHALGRFIRVGPPRRHITFIKGNHDVNLHWPGVQGRIRQALAATSGRAQLLTFEERCISREGIYVEHGNQYAGVVNYLQDMEEPHDHDKPGQLATPPGSWFVMDVLNEVERDRYWIDGIKPVTALIWYALAYDFPFAARAIATLIRALPGILDEIVFAVEETPAEELARQLEDPEQVADMAARYEADEAFRAHFNAEVASVLSPAPEIPGELAFALPGVPDAVTMGDQTRHRVHSLLYEMAQVRALEERVTLVTFGHSHDASFEPLPGGGVYINSGTWTWRADLSAAGAKTWRDLFEHPEWFANDRLLSYVRIDYDDAGAPTGQLLVYEPAPDPEPGEETSARSPSLWNHFLAWLRGLWARITGAA